MKKIINKSTMSSWLLCFISLVISSIAMNYLPNQIPIHFATNGTADSFGSKYTLFLIPLVIALIIIIAEIKKAPKNAKKDSNRYYFQIVFFVNSMIIALQIYTIAAACKWEIVNINNFILVIFGLLVMSFGNMMPKFSHNFSIGIRTKWTLSNEAVWYHTHRFCAKLWFIGGALLVISAFMQGILRIICVIIILIGLVIVPILYSKYDYKKIIV